MATDLFVLSESDKNKLKYLLDRVEGTPYNTLGRGLGAINNEIASTYQAPEVYVVKTDGDGIDELVDIYPGTAVCNIYFLHKPYGQPARLELTSYNETIYNISTSPVPPDTFVIVRKERSTHWVVDAPASPAICDPIPIQEVDIRCEDGDLNLYRRIVTIGLNSFGCLTKTLSSYVFYATIACCDASCAPPDDVGTADTTYPTIVDTATGTSTSGSSLTLTTSTSNPGDVLIVPIVTPGTIVPVPPDDSWTLLESQPSPGNEFTVYNFAKIVPVGGADPTYTFTVTAGGSFGLITTVTDVDVYSYPTEYGTFISGGSDAGTLTITGGSGGGSGGGSSTGTGTNKTSLLITTYVNNTPGTFTGPGGGATLLTTATANYGILLTTTTIPASTTYPTLTATTGGSPASAGVTIGLNKLFTTDPNFPAYIRKGVTTTTTGASITLTTPTHNAGDMLVAVLNTPAPTTFSNTDGFTTVAGGGVASYVQCMQFTATGSDPATFTFTNVSGSIEQFGFIMVIRNFDSYGNLSASNATTNLTLTNAVGGPANDTINSLVMAIWTNTSALTSPVAMVAAFVDAATTGCYLLVTFGTVAANTGAGQSYPARTAGGTDTGDIHGFMTSFDKNA